MITRARASALLFGALACRASPGWAQNSATLRVATLPFEDAAEPYYAEDEGFFAKVGLQVDIQRMQGSPAIAAAVTSNSVDIGYNAVDTLANIHQKLVPLAVIAPAADYVSPTTAGTIAIVVRASAPIHQAKDLSGKIIAVGALHTLGETASRLWIDRNGGDSSTVKFVEVPGPAMLAALDADRIDAAFMGEPFIEVAKKNDRILVSGLDAIAKQFLISAWFTTPRWAAAHPDLVKRFAAAMRETAVWANANEAASGDILAKHTRIAPAVIRTMVRAHFAEKLIPELMQPLIDVSAKYNGFRAFPAQELIYATP